MVFMLKKDNKGGYNELITRAVLVWWEGGCLKPVTFKQSCRTIFEILKTEKNAVAFCD